MARNQGGFDYFPVTGTALQGQEQIVGLVELVPFLRGNPACGVVRDYLLPLAEDNLIGADAGILTFVRTADRHPCRLVVSGSQVSGLVSLSDLQKLPVRAALFALITQLEMTMANAIRRELGNTDGWKERLPDDRKEKIDCQRKMVAADGNLVDDLLFTQYRDKITIIRRSPAFKASKGRFKDENGRRAETPRQPRPRERLRHNTRGGGEGLCHCPQRGGMDEAPERLAVEWACRGRSRVVAASLPSS